MIWFRLDWLWRTTGPDIYQSDQERLTGLFLRIWTIATEFRDRRQREERKHRLNREITATEVRITGPENEPLGVVSIAEALRMAGEYDVDLVEIAPMATPPVCRLMDYGKFKYKEQKKAAKAKSKQKVIDVK